MTTSPFHDGELAIQDRVGARERWAHAGAMMIRDAMPEQHRLFFEDLPTLLIGGLDAEGWPWASVLAGSPGFMSSPDPRHLRVDALPRGDDPLAAGWRSGASVGLLGLQPHTRRRNRMNGRLVAVDSKGFTVEVDQSFGNCPQYIQARKPMPASSTGPASGVVSHRAQEGSTIGLAHIDPAHLSRRARQLITAADTLFIASAATAAAPTDAAHGVDMSHRGGRAGFVDLREVADGTIELTIPDYRGNLMFNTLGNLSVYPRAGLLFIDYDNGDLLQVVGDTEIVWDRQQVAQFDGAQRLLRLRVRRAVLRESALPLRWTPRQYAPQLASSHD